MNYLLCWFLVFKEDDSTDPLLSNVKSINSTDSPTELSEIVCSLSENNSENFKIN